MQQAFRPHDLIWPASPAGLRSAVAVLPDWLNPAWPVVIRRAPADGLWLPVGLRGHSRSLRHAAFLLSEGATLCATPESLVTGWQQHPELLVFHCVRLLKAVAKTCNALALPWGPTGSVGFALATGEAVLRTDSDLDLVVKATQPLTVGQIELLHTLEQQAQHFQCCIDVQIDTGQGAFAFSEWQRTAQRVLLKTDAGPVLTEDPWGTTA